MFQSTTIPVLEQVINFAQARHGVLAGNIANIDTPGYRTADLSPELFQAQLREAIENHDHREAPTSPGLLEAESYDALGEVSENLSSILYHDESDVSLEHQIAEISKNQSTHSLALTILSNQFRQLQTAVSERVI